MSISLGKLMDTLKLVNLLILNDSCASISRQLRHNGHVHDSFDYRVGHARVIANPRGYASNRLMAGAPADLRWENPAFDPALVIEV
jgi:hypothetical protein